MFVPAETEIVTMLSSVMLENFVVPETALFAVAHAVASKTASTEPSSAETVNANSLLTEPQVAVYV